MNIRHIAFGVGLVSFGLTAFGCSSSTKATGTADSGVNGSGGGGGGGGAPSGTPTVEITAPVDGHSVDVSTSADVPVELKITNFTLKDPAVTGPCAKGSCGHLHLLVDDGDGNFTQCNNKDTPNTPYNEAAVALTGNTVGLDYCPKMNGPHTIKAEIHNDDHSPVLGADGKVITSNLIHITATGGPDGG